MFTQLIEQRDFVLLAFVLVSMIIGMATHEAMHAFVGHALGDDTAELEGRLTLNPLKHIDIFTTVLLPVVMITVGLPPIFAAKPVPFNPNRVKWDEFGAALIGIAGPLTNLALACIGAIIWRLDIITSAAVANFVLIFILMNVSVFVFNMIPFPPLDGSRLLYAFAPEPVQRVMRTIESFGLASVFILVLFVWQFIGPTILTVMENLFLLLVG